MSDTSLKGLETHRQWLRDVCEDDQAVMWACDNASEWRAEWLNGEELEWVFFTFANGPSECAWNPDDGWDDYPEFYEHYTASLRAALQAATERAQRAEKLAEAHKSANATLGAMAKGWPEFGEQVVLREAAEAQVRELRDVIDGLARQADMHPEGSQARLWIRSCVELMRAALPPGGGK